MNRRPPPPPPPELKRLRHIASSLARSPLLRSLEPGHGEICSGLSLRAIMQLMRAENQGCNLEFAPDPRIHSACGFRV